MCPLKKIRTILIVTGIVACAAAVALAQEFRGSITGRVIDNNGAAVANATVAVTSAATNASSSTTTNEHGDYTALYLTPGSYSVTVEATGFKKSTRQNVEIRVGDKLQIDLQLEVGNVSDTVNVTSDAPLLETNTASAGQVIDRRRISELPLSDGNPFVLTRLAPGIAYTGDLLFSRPFDNGGTSSIVADGATGGNERAGMNSRSMAHPTWPADAASPTSSTARPTSSSATISCRPTTSSITSTPRSAGTRTAKRSAT